MTLRCQVANEGIVPPFPADAPRNRLGLAQWLTAPDHPLLARVTVNRFWQSLFGRGLVSTADDFGNQSDRAEYPELLDWLAGEFVRSGWDVKALWRTIILSQTYRQRSFASPTKGLGRSGGVGSGVSGGSNSGSSAPSARG